eukprot:6545223-Prymnesium_polylepis.1
MNSARLSPLLLYSSPGSRSAAAGRGLSSRRPNRKRCRRCGGPLGSICSGTTRAASPASRRRRRRPRW